MTIKGIIESTPADVSLELDQWGFHPGITYRMWTKRLDNEGRKTTTQNILVNVLKTRKHIFNLRYLVNLVIKV